ncbi:MAG: PqqD family protein [Candidatus Omnitrophica bacterium]|nr:PqqD family protein [Candidatus Omnitrophota bacterium]
MDNSLVLKRNPDFVMRVIEDETILIPIYKTSEEADYIYTLNKVGQTVWNLIDGKKTLDEIKKEILKRFGATPEEVEKELLQFLNDLKEIKALV